MFSSIVEIRVNEQLTELITKLPGAVAGAIDKARAPEKAPALDPDNRVIRTPDSPDRGHV